MKSKQTGQEISKIKQEATHTLRLTPRHMSLTQGQGKQDKLERQWAEGPDMDTRQTRETRSKTQR